MSFLDTKHKRESAAITGVIALLILFLIFNFGLRYFDPPIEYGIAVNFGTSDVGSGEVQPTEPLKSASEETENEEEIIDEVVQEQAETATALSEAAAEDVITQNNEEAIAIKKQEDTKRKKEADLQKKLVEEQNEADRKAEVERKKIEAEKQRIEKEKQEKAAKRKNLDELMGGFNNENGAATGGEGNDNQVGDKGKVTGDPSASGYYGNGGNGGGGDYRLGNRKVLTKPKPTYDCNEEGRVFVSISVDTSGKVIAAQAGVKGTTNSAPCLLTRAKEAALKTKFNSDGNAPAKQIGIIIYNFSLS
jgi:colicin import membrane protein